MEDETPKVPDRPTEDAADRNRLTNRVGLVISAVLVLFIIVAALLVLAFGDKANPPLMICVFASAVLGSLITITDRVREHFTTGDWRHVLIVIAWKLLASCALAMFLYLFFMSGFLTGPLFPEFRVDSEKYTNIIDFANMVKPDTNADLAKVLVWSFVAGYSERFVSRLIGRLEAGSPGVQ